MRVSNESRGCVLHGGVTGLQWLLGLLIPGDVGTYCSRPEDVAETRTPVAVPELPIPVLESSTKPYLDENVQFTTYCPGQIPPEQYKPLLVFAHLEELPPDAAADVPDPVEEVRRQAQTLLGDAIAGYRESTHESRQAIPRESELTFVVAFDGLRCNPPRHTVFWEEPVHRVEFRLKAPVALEGQTCRGQLTVFLGDLLIAQADLRVKVSSADPKSAAPPQRVDARPYRRIFASYSRRDLPMVEQFERYAAALGDRYLRDLVDLRAGEAWNSGLERMIREADVFQLFWSQNSMRSEFCRQEWEYALSLQRPNFIRPTYWEQPFPEELPHLPPEELRAKHFQLLGRYIPVGAAASSPGDSVMTSAPVVSAGTHKDTGPVSRIDVPPLPTLPDPLADPTDTDLELSLDDEAEAAVDLDMCDESDFAVPGEMGDASLDLEADEDDFESDAAIMALDDDDSVGGDSFNDFDDDEVVALDDEFEDEFDAAPPLGGAMYQRGAAEVDHPSGEQGVEMPLAQRLGIFVVCALVLLGGIIGAALMLSDKEPEIPDSEVRYAPPSVNEPIERPFSTHATQPVGFERAPSTTAVYHGSQWWW